MPDVELVGFVEPSDAAAAELTEKVPARRFPDVQSLAREIDAAVVAASTTAHRDLAVQLIEAGCDVMVEKPIATTAAEAAEMIGLARSRSCIVQVGHVERYNPAIQAALPLAGDVRYVEADRLGVYTGRSLDIDVLLDLMIHDLQLVLAVLGDGVASVHAVGIPVLTTKVDMANVRIEMKSGAVANLTASRVSSERVRKFRMFGSGGYLSVDTKDQKVHGYRRVRGASGDLSIETVAVEVAAKEPLRAELDGFVDCVRTRRRPLVSGEEGMAALELAIRVGEAIQRSLESWKGNA